MTTCPKCTRTSGDDWSQCGGSCPMPMSPHYDPAKQHERERSEHDAIRALLAANAVLASTLRAYYEAERAEGQNGGPTFGEWQQILTRVEEALSQPHPGAALLSEMDALRKRVEDWAAGSEALQAECNRLKAERDEARAQADTARAAALEEAKAEFRSLATPYTTWTAADAVKVLDSLATTPPPPVVPVAKVREVLRGIYETSKRIRDGLAQRDMRHAEHSGRMGASFAAARDLGIPINGEP